MEPRSCWLLTHKKGGISRISKHQNLGKLPDFFWLWQKGWHLKVVTIEISWFNNALRFSVFFPDHQREKAHESICPYLYNNYKMPILLLGEHPSTTGPSTLQYRFVAKICQHVTRETNTYAWTKGLIFISKTIRNGNHPPQQEPWNNQIQQLPFYTRVAIPLYHTNRSLTPINPTNPTLKTTQCIINSPTLG